MQAFNRQFSPYEMTHLQRHGVSFSQARDLGEMPVEYITGHVDFGGLDLLVSPDVLIPRVETEELVTLVAQTIEAEFPDQVVSIAEIGTGSGAISLALAHKLIAMHHSFSVTAGDISPAALKIARQNQTRLFKVTSASQKLALIHSDLWSNFPPQKFSIVIANLPYIPSARLASLDKSVIDFEPKLALDGGADGLDLIRQLIQTSLPHLLPEAQLFLEIDETHTQAKISLIDQRFEVKIIADQFAKNRFAHLQLKP